MLRPTDRMRIEDQSFSNDETSSDFSNHLLVRVASKGRRFENVNFDHTIFESCYFRNCTFVSCTFFGCRFVAVNFRGSSFSKCKFDYATFEKTYIANDVLDRESPQLENLKAEFARSLRINYQQLGDAQSANKAIHIELEATKAHLRYAWSSPASYYREKYAGLKRAEYFLRWLAFKILDLLWGNGESPWKLLRAILFLFVGMTIYDVLKTKEPANIASYKQAFFDAPSIFLGVMSDSLPRWYLTSINAIRLVTFGAFVSILTKRLNRR